MPLYEFKCKNCERQVLEHMTIAEYECLQRENIVSITRNTLDAEDNIKEVKIAFGMECVCGFLLERVFSSFKFEMK